MDGNQTQNTTGFEVNTGATKDEVTGQNWLGQDKITTSEAFNLRGFDSNQVETVQASINAYQAELDAILDGINTCTTEKIQVALKGSAQETTVTNYINEIVANIKNVTAYIDKFDNALNTVAANYLAQSGAVTVSSVESTTIDEDIAGVQPFNG